MPGRIALVGSGEYLPAMHDVERWLLEDTPPRFVQLATAAAPEGDNSIRYWRELGAAAAARLGVEQVFIDARTRDDAHDANLVDLVRGAGLVYFSGGNPGFLARTLSGTPLLDAVLDEWAAGSSLAGCSAGAMALGGYVPNLRHPREGGTSGFAVVPDVRVLPHFDRYAQWLPNFAAGALVGEGFHVVGIDEDTALVADAGEAGDWNFRAVGTKSAWEVTSNGKTALTEVMFRVERPQAP